MAPRGRKKVPQTQQQQQRQQHHHQQPAGAADKALESHQSKILALLKGDAAEGRAEAFELLKEAAKAPRGLLLLEDEFEVSAAGVMVPCVHPLLEIISRPFEPLPPSVSGSVSVLVDEKTSNAIAEFKLAAHQTVEEKCLATIVDRLQSAPVRHDDARSTWKPKKAMRADEWRGLASAIVSVLPCRRCLDPVLNATGQCRTDCYECARLVRQKKVELQQQRAQTHADECAEASEVLQLITAARDASDPNTLMDEFGRWKSPLGLLRSGLDCPPAQVKAMKAVTQPKPKDGDPIDGESEAVREGEKEVGKSNNTPGPKGNAKKGKSTRRKGAKKR